MPRTSTRPAVDPVFAEIAKAIYGDVDPRELLGKAAPDGSAVHVDGPVKPAKRKMSDEKRLAITGLGATGVAGVAGLHALRATGTENADRLASALKLPIEPKPVGRVVGTLMRHGIKPKRAAAIVGGSLLALHGVELVGDTLGLRAQVRAIKAANKENPPSPATPAPVAKAFRLKPLNTLPRGVPSLRAKRVRMNPMVGSPRTNAGVFQPVSKGLRSRIKGRITDVKTTLRNVQTASESANSAAATAQSTAEKIKHLIPSRRTAILTGAGTAGALVGATYLGNRSAAKKKVTRAVVSQLPLAPMAKSAEVVWTGEFSKVDTEKRQVFGWASVSAINGEDIVDLQGDIVPIEETEKAAYKYVLESRKGGDMHRRVSKFDDGSMPLHTADMIESFVVTPEKLEKLGLPPDCLPHGWWVGYHVNDDTQWNMVKSGERTGFSIHGKGTRKSLSKAMREDPGSSDLGQPPTRRPFENPKKHRLRVVRFKQDQQMVNQYYKDHYGLSKADGPGLRERARQAVHPPAVKLYPVSSSAVNSMGYQPQTKRLAYEMRSRKGAPYNYRVGGSQGVEALMAPSKGHYFATQVRGKADRPQHYTPADRARLFFDPQRGDTDG